MIHSSQENNFKRINNKPNNPDCILRFLYYNLALNKAIIVIINYNCQ